MSISTVPKSRSRKTITGITLAALFAALTAGGTFVSIPLPLSPVPVVLQNLFIVLAGLVLGPALGTAAAALFLAAGALGAPVFAGASGGIAHFAGPTGGFLAGYLLAPLAAGLAAGKPRPLETAPESKLEEKRTAGTARLSLRTARLAAAAALGFLVIYIPGVIRLRYLLGSWTAALGAGLVPFIAGDAIKAAAALAAAPRLRRAVAALAA